MFWIGNKVRVRTNDLKNKTHSARLKAALAVNHEVTSLRFRELLDITTKTGNLDFLQPLCHIRSERIHLNGEKS